LGIHVKGMNPNTDKHPAIRPPSRQPKSYHSSDIRDVDRFPNTRGNTRTATRIARLVFPSSLSPGEVTAEPSSDSNKPSRDKSTCLGLLDSLNCR